MLKIQNNSNLLIDIDSTGVVVLEDKSAVVSTLPKEENDQLRKQGNTSHIRSPPATVWSSELWSTQVHTGAKWAICIKKFPIFEKKIIVL